MYVGEIMLAVMVGILLTFLLVVVIARLLTGILKGLPAREDLDPPEIGIALGAKGSAVLASVVLGLIGKGVLRISSLDPLRFELVNGGGELNRYERELLSGMKGGDFDPSSIASCLRAVEKRVISKMKGFSFGRTIERYREVLNSKWEEAIGSGGASAEELRWLVVDPDLLERMAELGGGARRTVESILDWAEARIKSMPMEAAHPSLRRRGINLHGARRNLPPVAVGSAVMWGGSALAESVRSTLNFLRRKREEKEV